MQNLKPVRWLLCFFTLFFFGMRKDALLHAQAAKEYCNQRYGYCISYNPELLKPAPEAQNGDGRIFKDIRGAEKLSVYGTGNWTFNDDGTAITLEQLYRIELKGGRFPKEGTHRIVTYKTSSKTAFIFSGTEGKEIFYIKVLKRDDAFCYAWLHYTATEADKYKPVAELIAHSFN